MSNENSRERDLVLAPNEFALLLDETKGNVIAYVGPHKTSLANTDRPVLYDIESGRFRRSNLEEAITPFPFAQEGWYIVLENPREGDDEHPKGGPNSLPRLTLGRKINIPGPATFPLWPGQVARVVPGHHLRSNQYLVVQVYNEEAARENWARAVIKPHGDAGMEAPELTLGKLLVIKGTEVSFYIPPTGIEVLADPQGNFLRWAVTLERLEYCILLDEDGNKRFIEGPDVVFPRPTERFVEKKGVRKFKAIELNELKGLYIKVIAPYTDAGGVERKIGEELFLTGKELMIYFPRPEHAIIRYGESDDTHHAVALPAGQARYLLNRQTGEIVTRKGPAMLLPDPRKEVLVRRVLTPTECHLLYPGNAEVLEYNLALGGTRARTVPQPIMKKAIKAEGAAIGTVMRDEAVGEGSFGDDFMRSQTFSSPRMLTLDDRFDGAVTVNVWTGYAMQVVSRTGQRRVAVGPESVILEYDETLEAMELSTGTPKNDDNLIKTVYLRVINNKVSDEIEAETRDLCRVNIRLSYRVNFEGDPTRWFNVENYVKFLTDHLRSIVRGTVKQKGIEEFYSSAISIVRDAVLGVSAPEGRKGRFFEENGMRVYDLDVLDVIIGDKTIAQMLTEAQHDAVRQTIRLAEESRQLEVTQRSEEIKRSMSDAQFETSRQLWARQLEEVSRTLEVTLAKLGSQARNEEEQLKRRQSQQVALDEIDKSERTRDRVRKEQDLELARIAMDHRLAELAAEVKSASERAKAFSPDLIAALQSFGDQHLAQKVAESMAPLAILGGKSVAEVFSQMLKGTPLEAALRTNGHALSAPTS